MAGPIRSLEAARALDARVAAARDATLANGGVGGSVPSRPAQLIVTVPPSVAPWTTRDATRPRAPIIDTTQPPPALERDRDERVDDCDAPSMPSSSPAARWPWLLKMALTLLALLWSAAAGADM